jgi:hypothetical protein
MFLPAIVRNRGKTWLLVVGAGLDLRCSRTGCDPRKVGSDRRHRRTNQPGTPSSSAWDGTRRQESGGSVT